MIKNDREPYCNGVGVFYQYWIVGGFTYLAERLAREIRGRHKTHVSKVIQHPSGVCEIQIKKDNTITRAGQVSIVLMMHTGWKLTCCSTFSYVVPKCLSGNIIHSP